MNWSQSSKNLIGSKDDESPINDNIKRIREKWTDDDITAFYEKQVDIAKLRKDSMTGESWDAGYCDFLRSLLSPMKQATKRNNKILRQAFFDDLDHSTISTLNNNEDPLSVPVGTYPKRRKSSTLTDIPVDLNDNDDDDGMPYQNPD